MSQPSSRPRPDGVAGNAHSTRREVLKLAMAAGVAGAQLRLPARAGAQEAVSPTADLCLLTPEQTAGPFYLPLELMREDITEGRPGLPLRLQIAVADATACTPLPEAAVDIWHCDAQGYYSGVNANPGGNAAPEPGTEQSTFLRGVQLADEDGIAEFLTIYPGWYSGRTVHIHLMVHVGGIANEPEAVAAGEAAEGYEGGYVVHTGQIYFEDAISDEVFATGEAYAGRDNARRTRNDQDNILGGHADEPGFIMTLTRLNEDAPEEGFLGQIMVGVDASAGAGG